MEPCSPPTPGWLPSADLAGQVVHMQSQHTAESVCSLLMPDPAVFAAYLKVYVEDRDHSSRMIKALCNVVQGLPHGYPRDSTTSGTLVNAEYFTNIERAKNLCGFFANYCLCATHPQSGETKFYVGSSGRAAYSSNFESDGSAQQQLRESTGRFYDHRRMLDNHTHNCSAFQQWVDSLPGDLVDNVQFIVLQARPRGSPGLYTHAPVATGLEEYMTMLALETWQIEKKRKEGISILNFLLPGHTPGCVHYSADEKTAVLEAAFQIVDDALTIGACLAYKYTDGGTRHGKSSCVS